MAAHIARLLNSSEEDRANIADFLNEYLYSDEESIAGDYPVESESDSSSDDDCDRENQPPIPLFPAHVLPQAQVQQVQPEAEENNNSTTKNAPFRYLLCNNNYYLSAWLTRKYIGRFDKFICLFIMYYYYFFLWVA